VTTLSLWYLASQPSSGTFLRSFLESNGRLALTEPPEAGKPSLKPTKPPPRTACFRLQAAAALAFSPGLTLTTSEFR
jgi:hypothetical protein